MDESLGLAILIALACASCARDVRATGSRATVEAVGPAPALAAEPLRSPRGPAPADPWPGWRGVRADGIAAGPAPVSWSEGRNVRWKVAVGGRGTSSPIVWGDLVIVTTAIATGRRFAVRGNDGGLSRRARRNLSRREKSTGREWSGEAALVEEQELWVLAFDRIDGSTVWRRRCVAEVPHQNVHPDASYAAQTPATDGDLVIASFGSLGIFALTVEGEIAWERDLGDQDVVNSFGEGSSPVLADGLVLLSWDQDGPSALVALDERSGEERWRTAREDGTTWTTPVVVAVGGRKQVVVGAGRTIAYDLETGEEIWAFGEPNARRGGAIASPVHTDGVLIVPTAGREGEIVAIRLAEAEGELQAGHAAILWTHAGSTPYVPSPIALDGLLYVLRTNSGILTAYDVLTGEVRFGPRRLAGIEVEFASPVAAGGNVYFVDRFGSTEVISSGLQPVSLAVNRLDDTFDASPAVSGGALFLRGASFLYCIAADAPADR